MCLDGTPAVYYLRRGWTARIAEALDVEAQGSASPSKEDFSKKTLQVSRLRILSVSWRMGETLYLQL